MSPTTLCVYIHVRILATYVSSWHRRNFTSEEVEENIFSSFRIHFHLLDVSSFAYYVYRYRRLIDLRYVYRHVHFWS